MATGLASPTGFPFQESFLVIIFLTLCYLRAPSREIFLVGSRPGSNATLKEKQQWQQQCEIFLIWFWLSALLVRHYNAQSQIYISTFLESSCPCLLLRTVNNLVWVWRCFSFLIVHISLGGNLCMTLGWALCSKQAMEKLQAGGNAWAGGWTRWFQDVSSNLSDPMWNSWNIYDD